MPKHPKEKHEYTVESITAKMDAFSVNQFPTELEQLSDSEQYDDDDILANFQHDTEKEYEDVLKYHRITYECVMFIKESSKIAFTPLQRRKIQQLAYRLYEKMVIYQKEIMLNSLDTTYHDLDSDERKTIQIISRYMNKIHDLAFELKKKSLFKKSELNIFFNNSYKLFSTIISYMEHVWKKSSTT